MKQAVGPLVLLGLLLILHLGLRDYVYDDAYIQIRIASHLVQYGQPYFNVGEAVNSSSSPVWTVVVAAVLALSRLHLPAIAVVNAAISTLGVLTFLALLNSAVSLTVVDRIVAGAGYLAITLPASAGWMETPLALLVMSLGLLRYRRKVPDAFVLFGLLPFIRPEFAVLYPIVLLDALRARNMPLRSVLACSAAGTFPFLAYQFLYFGTIVPQAMEAKSIVYSLAYGDVLRAILSTLTPQSAFFSRIYGLFFWLPSLAIAAAVGGVFLFAGCTVWRRPPFLPTVLLLFGGGVIAAYVAGRALIFGWYVPIYLVPLFAALFLMPKSHAPRPLRQASLLLRAPILGLWALAVVPLGCSVFSLNLLPGFLENARTRSYLRIAQNLYKTYPDARLLTSEIGALGYGFPGYILDGAGLVTPYALRYQPLSVPAQRSGGAIGAIPIAFIEATRPEIIVSMDVFIEDFLRNGNKSDYFVTSAPIILPEDASYAGASLWGSDRMRIFIRRDVFAAAQSP